MARFLVTGGAGFIGSHLTDALIESGHDVVVLDDFSTGKHENIHQKAEVIEGCICDEKGVRKALKNVDGVFHLAAIASVEKSTEEWLHTHHVNLSGTVNIFDAVKDEMRARGVTIPVVYASSAAIYGNPENVPIDEEHMPCPLSAYGADKLGCEYHGVVASHVHGIPNAGMRFFNVYGPRQDPKSPYSGVISIFAERISKGQDITIHGDGLQTRDFIYVSDVVKALVTAYKWLSDGAHVFNVCGGNTVTIVKLAEMIAEHSKMPLDATFGPAREGDIRLSQGAPERALNMLGFKAEIPLDKGLFLLLDDLKKSA